MESGGGGLLYLNSLKLIPQMEFGYLILSSHQKKRDVSIPRQSAVELYSCPSVDLE